MKTKHTLLARLTALNGLLGAVALALVLVLLYQSHANWRQAVHLEVRNQIAAHSLAAVKHFAFERGRTNVILRGAAPISAKNRSFIDERRRQADASIQAIPGPGRAFPEETRAIMASWEVIQALRGEVEANFVLPLEKRDASLTKRWLAASNTLVERLESLLVLASQVEGADFHYARLANLRIQALQFRNAIGFESTLLSAELSARRVPDTQVLGEADRLHGRSQQDRKSVV
jgi:hypothetical protein